ncbi:MAG: KAP family NTPase, partial [Candidatus Obscuribacterales bacterium]|nr:KAP family NTPase [Candidatus Obscuribacterales bacterium]
MLRIDFLWNKKTDENVVETNGVATPYDIPLTRAEEDKFGYDSFAKHASNVLVKLPDIDGCVAAVNAPWGMGKTTFLNFLRNYFEGSGKNGDTRRVIYFNPWLSSSRSEMIGLF